MGDKNLFSENQDKAGWESFVKEKIREVPPRAARFVFVGVAH
jgi:hypothetical protein